MSNHIFKSQSAKHSEVTVEMGYDRPLNYVYCTVHSDSDRLLYSNLDDPDAGIRMQDIQYFKKPLQRLKIVVPERIFQEVTIDQKEKVGNKTIVWTKDTALPLSKEQYLMKLAGGNK